jgi:hypothetical protein
MTEIVVGDARVVLGDCRDVLRTLMLTKHYSEGKADDGNSV